MRLKEIHLTNFRCFEQLDVQLNDRLAVFIGVNGAGKTAILEAINSLFAEDYVANFFSYKDLESRQRQRLIESRKNMRIGAKKASISINIEFNLIDKFDWNLEFEFPTTTSFGYQRSNDIYNWVLKFIKKSEQSPLINLPLYAFYKSEKAIDVNDENFLNPEDIKLKQLWAFKNVFRNEKDSFTNLLIWFDDKTNYENSIRLEKDFAYRDPKFQIVRQSITAFLATLTDSSFKNLRIIKKDPDYVFDSSKNVLTITKDSIDIDVNLLSAGEKSIILLIADLAKRLAIANPSLENPLEGEGIVLIDEIDLHLHPQWQRNILPALLATFPKCQFIVTTHSPLVISNVAQESVFILDNGKLVKNTPHTLGRDYASILYNVFGVEERPAEYQKKLDLCFRLLENEQYPEAKILLKKLSKELGEDDIDIVRANVILDMEA
jgi:predicted ATP-binding protein involved in virulence